MQSLKTYAKHVIFIIWYGLLNVVLLLYSNSFLYVMLVWNVLLAFVPLVFADVTGRLYRKRTPLWILTALLWFIFLPNSYYMVTDFIHLSGDEFFVFDALKYRYSYSINLFLWLKMAVVGMGMVYATLCGIRSFYTLHDSLVKPLGIVVSTVFGIGVFVSNGVAIYIGRFLRLNSWNIFELADWYQYWRNYGHGLRFTVIFIAILSLYVATVTLIYPLFTDNRRNNDSDLT